MEKETAKAHLIESLRQVISHLEEVASRREALAADDRLFPKDKEGYRTAAKYDRELIAIYRDQLKVEEELDC